MGQTQFLPSNFLAYAVDADGDGRRDIWGSVADVMASTANFLASSGWQTGQPWGLEVTLPSGFDYAHADADLRQPASVWAEEGVQSLNSTPVSYTHLDVYKRQGVDGKSRTFTWRSEIKEISVVVAVSAPGQALSLIHI